LVGVILFRLGCILNWWMNVTRVPGITPQGSSNESYNVNRVKGSKKVAPVVSLNVSMQRFLGSSLPAILENDANNNLGECSICIPTNYFDPQSVDIACLMTEGIGFKEFNDTPASMPTTWQMLIGQWAVHYWKVSRNTSRPWLVMSHHLMTKVL
jgi:hypothetical protein